MAQPLQQPCKKTILAVDDAPENLDVIQSILVPDYSIRVATNGALALKIASAQLPDLILLDISMPDMDGYEVCRRLKSAEATRQIPTIFVTARDQAEDEALGLELGAVDYIAKPIKASILRARVRTHLALSEANRQLFHQNKALIEAARLREDVEHITRHDLKSPLNVIIGFPQLLLTRDYLTKEDQEYIKLIEESGYRMLNMINRSLDTFKMENETYEFRPWPIDLLAVMNGVLSELRTQTTEKNLRTCLTVDGSQADEHHTVDVMAESLLCHSMFSNLCKNAIEASPNGGNITINFCRGSATEVSIENDGEVPIKIRDRFFEKFSTSGKHNGTGLGTYSAMLIAKTQKGSIALDSSISGRTRVVVTIPSASKR